MATASAGKEDEEPVGTKKSRQKEAEAKENGEQESNMGQRA